MDYNTFTEKVNRYLLRVATLEIILSITLVFMPIALRFEDDWRPWRTSISDYVYTECGHIFGMFFTAAAFMFIYNGVIYFKKEAEILKFRLSEKTGDNEAFKINKLKNSQPPGAWYNIVLGISLLLVMLLPHLENIVLHYIFAVVFFAGSIALMLFLKSNVQRGLAYFLAGISSVSLVLHLILGCKYPLFWAEWVAFTAIAIHYVAEALTKIKRQNKLDDIKKQSL